MLTKKSVPNKQQYTHKNLCQQKGQTEPGLVAFYDIQPGNGVGLFLQSQSPQRVQG